MERILIRKIKDEQIKDNSSGFILRSVGYGSSVDNDLFYMVGVGSCVFPDIFEMDQHAFRKSKRIQNVVREINNISINSYAIHNCPFCKAPIAHLDKQLICFNINCVVDEYPNTITLYKLQLLLNNHHTEFIRSSIDRMVELGKIISVVSVINFIRASEFTEDEDIEAQMLFDCEIDCMPLSHFLHAISGADFKGLYSLIIKYYNNSIVEMLEDVQTIFEPLHNLRIPSELRILLFNMFMVNKSLLECMSL